MAASPASKGNIELLRRDAKLSTALHNHLQAMPSQNVNLIELERKYKFCLAPRRNGSDDVSFTDPYGFKHVKSQVEGSVRKWLVAIAELTSALGGLSNERHNTNTRLMWNLDDLCKCLVPPIDRERECGRTGADTVGASGAHTESRVGGCAADAVHETRAEIARLAAKALEGRERGQLAGLHALGHMCALSLHAVEDRERREAALEALLDADHSVVAFVLHNPPPHFAETCVKERISLHELRIYFDDDAVHMVQSGLARVLAILHWIDAFGERAKNACTSAIVAIQKHEAAAVSTITSRDVYVLHRDDLFRTWPVGPMCAHVPCPAATHVHGLDNYHICRICTTPAQGHACFDIGVRAADVVLDLVGRGVLNPWLMRADILLAPIARFGHMATIELLRLGGADSPASTTATASPKWIVSMPTPPTTPMLERFTSLLRINVRCIVPALRLDFVLMRAIYSVGSALNNNIKCGADQSISVSAVLVNVHGVFCGDGSSGCAATFKKQSKHALQARVAALMQKLVRRTRGTCSDGLGSSCGAVYGSLPGFGSGRTNGLLRRHPQMGVYGDTGAMAAFCAFVHGLMQRMMQDGLRFAAQESWFPTRSDEKRKRDQVQ